MVHQHIFNELGVRRWRDSGGEAASLREAPLPQTPSPEEWLGFELVASAYSSPLRVRRDFLQIGCGHGGIGRRCEICEGGGFSKRSPSLALPPEEWLGIGLSFPLELIAHASWARFLANWLWSRRLTEPPRPCGMGRRYGGCEGGGFSREAPPSRSLPKSSWK